MRKTYALRIMSLAALSTFLAASVFAQEDGYYYGGLSIGQSRAEIDSARITASLLDAGLVTTAMMRDEKDTAYKLFGGYQFHRYLAIEAGYFNLGQFGFHTTTLPAGTLNGQIKLHGANLDLVGRMPLTQRLSAMARVGGQYAKARDTFSSSGAIYLTHPNPSKGELNYKVGVGMQYAVTPAFLIRGEAERYRVNDAVSNRGTINVFSVSLVFPFGRGSDSSAEAPPMIITAPPPVVMASVAPVVVAAAEAAPQARKVTFSADSLFRFDQSSLMPEGKAALDVLTRNLQGASIDMIIVQGHTDRLGSDAYNQRLSSERAQAVKAYLVTVSGIDASKISASGKGESEPITQPSNCKLNKPRAKLITCLQPDRRVEVEVTGTR